MIVTIAIKILDLNVKFNLELCARLIKQMELIFFLVLTVQQMIMLPAL